MKINKFNKILDYILITVCFVQSLLLMVQLFISDTGIVSEKTATLLRIIFSVLPTFFALLIVLYRKPILFINTYFLAFALLFISYLLNTNNYEAIVTEGIKYFLGMTIPIFLSIQCLKMITINNIMNFLHYISIFILLIAFIYIYSYLNGYLIITDVYNMSFGYALLMPASYFFYRNKFRYICLGFVSLFLVLVLGSRGPVIAALSFYIVHNLIISSKRGVVLKLLFFSLFSFLFITFISLIIANLDVIPRSLKMIVAGDFITSDTGRSALYNVIKGTINKNPILGNGIFGDRIYLNGVYTHNFFLEILNNYGLIVGLILIILFVFTTFMIFIKSDLQDRRLLLLFGFTGCIPLLVSSSYLIYPNFFFFLGFLYYKINNKNFYR